MLKVRSSNDDEQSIRLKQTELLESVKREETLSLIKWLAPRKYEIQIHEEDLASARKLRHGGTCIWVLNRPQFQAWANATPGSRDSLLWISAVPGAGKTILSSFLIDYLRSNLCKAFPVTLFFMFKRKDADKNTSLSAVCSLTYQLLAHSPQKEKGLYEELIEHKDRSGQKKAKDFESLWVVLRRHIERQSSLALILDALDECKDIPGMVDHLKQLSSSSGARVIILSRRERDLSFQLEAQPQIRIGTQDNEHDISQYLDKQIEECSTLSLPSVSAQVSRNFGVNLAQLLLDRSNGSFLWAFLAIKELKRKLTPREIVETLKRAPSGIASFYEAILRSYAEELDSATADICRAVLRWLACATRPLSIDEVWEALRVEHTKSGFNTMRDEEFFLPRQEMVSSCGSLVKEENGTLHLAHLSLSEFLHKKTPGAQRDDEVQKFLVDLPEANWTLAMTSLEYIIACSSHFTIGSDDKYRRLDVSLETERHPLLEYAVSNWLLHLADCEVIAWQQVPAMLSNFCLSSHMLFWIELWFSMDRQNLWLLEQQIRRIISQCSGHLLQSERKNERFSFMHRWSIAMLQLLARHGPCCEEQPSYIHFIDPASFEENSDDSGVFAHFISNQPRLHTQHVRLHTRANQHHDELVTEPSLSNASKIHFPHLANHAFGVFHIDQQRNVIILADYMCTTPKLYCQDIRTGRTLPPTAHPYGRDRVYWCEGYSVSKDGNSLAIYHKSRLHLNSVIPESNKHHVVVWDFSDVLDFDHYKAKPWCTARSFVSRETQESHYSPQPVAFGKDGTLLCPYGRINISSSLSDQYLGPITGNYMDEVSAIRDNGAFGGLAFSADTLSLVVCDTKLERLIKMQIDDMTVNTNVQLHTSDVIICSISPRGRYAVWRERQSHRTCFLVDFATCTTKCLQGSEGVLFPTHSLLAFSVDEECLFGILKPQAESDHRKRYVSIWTDLPREPKQFTSQVVGEILGFHFTTLQEPAYLATSEHWAKIDPSKLETVADQFLHQGLIPKQQVSVHGDRLAVILYAPEISEGPK